MVICFTGHKIQKIQKITFLKPYSSFLRIWPPTNRRSPYFHDGLLKRIYFYITYLNFRLDHRYFTNLWQSGLKKCIDHLAAYVQIRDIDDLYMCIGVIGNVEYESYVKLGHRSKVKVMNWPLVKKMKICYL
jgi:hypothetical protein